MKRNFLIYTLGAMMAAVGMASCDDDDKNSLPDLSASTENSVMVNSFALKANDSVLANLDSVFFSIDLDRAEIFNADSLPVGTKVNRLQVSIGLPQVSKAEITMPNDRGVDTVVNYLRNSTDSINFSRGYVTLHLESANAKVTRDYRIYVNVHRMNPDAMAWGDLTSGQLPTSLSSIDGQHTVELGGQTLCFTQSGSDYCRATASDLSADSWTKESVALPAGARLETLTAGATMLYILDASDALYESTDCGSTWSTAGSTMSHIYGAIDDEVIGVRNDAGQYTYVTYPATSESTVPTGAPVEGTSPALVYTTDWSTSPLMIVGGGRDANGALVGSVWGYDGTQWAEFSDSSLPAVTGAVVVPYFAFKNTSTWRVTKNSVLLMMGGMLDGGILNRTIYLSMDYGVHWTAAPSAMQMSSAVTVGENSQAIVANTLMPSRAVTPITEWDCPYIYVFGGTDNSGNLNNRILRGVINRLTFKPLQ